MPLRPCSASSGHTREVRWGLHAPFQGAKEVAQPKSSGPAGWSRRGWAGLKPQRLGAQQGKVEAGRRTGQTGVFEGVGQEEEGREGTSQKEQSCGGFWRQNSLRESRRLASEINRGGGGTRALCQGTSQVGGGAGGKC